MKTYLDDILSWHRRRVQEDERDLGELLRAAERFSPRAPFVFDGPDLGVIAEFKRHSPSKGWIAPDASVKKIVRAYEAGGARAVSILTDQEFFKGSLGDLRRAALTCDLPLLRKDFCLSVRDVLDAKIAGASAVLVIVRALTHHELAEITRAALDVGLIPLVEIHSEEEIQWVPEWCALVGINRRDLLTFRVERERAEKLAFDLRGTKSLVAESGIESSSEVTQLGAAGFGAVLVGEHVMSGADPEFRVGELVEAGRGVCQDLRPH